jgi:small subunit ribosomal protein S7
MPRKGPAARRELVADPIHKSVLVTQLINKVMLHGKRTVAEKIVYDAMDIIQGRLDGDEQAIDTVKRAVDNVKPPLEVRSRRVGGATYQVPVEVRPARRQTLAMRWVIDAARKRSEKSMAFRLAHELMDAAENRGTAVKKKEDTHRMAEANKAFSHYRW